jgi:hypothetical protein
LKLKTDNHKVYGFPLAGGIKMAKHPRIEVKCSVSNCKYNKDNYCFANKLEVNAMGDGYAKTSDGTVCTTFISQLDDNQINS